MKRLFLCAVPLLLAACAAPRLQVVTLRSNQIPVKEKAFVLETDTMRLAYDFYSPNGSVRFIIRNKLNRPLYIDWGKSAFIQGTDRVPYWEDAVEFNTRFRSTGIDWTSWLSTNRGSVQGTMRREDRISFIPPGTEIRQVKFIAKPGDQLRFKPTLTPETESVRVRTQTGREIDSPLLRYRFEESSSPLVFRNYLTFSTDERFTNEFYVDSQFYVTEVEEVDGRALFGMDYTPGMLSGTITLAPDRFNAPNKFLLRVREQQ
jgi:hypothetical protein